MNLLNETEDSLRAFGYGSNAVMWVGTYDGTEACSWEDFEELADVHYFEGYGCQEVRHDLVVLLNDGAWLERAEYDGAEWWELRRRPTAKGAPLPLARVLREDDDY